MTNFTPRYFVLKKSNEIGPFSNIFIRPNQQKVYLPFNYKKINFEKYKIPI